MDALTPDRIRQIFAENLSEYIDSSEYFEHGKQVYLMSKIRDELDKYIDAIVSDIYNQMEDKVEMEEYNILDYVKNGKSYSPYGEVYSVDDSQISNCVKKYFE